MKCPRCKGPADNGCDREIPPNPYLCSKCDNTTYVSAELWVHDGETVAKLKPPEQKEIKQLEAIIKDLKKENELLKKELGYLGELERKLMEDEYTKSGE